MARVAVMVTFVCLLAREVVVFLVLQMGWAEMMVVMVSIRLIAMVLVNMVSLAALATATAPPYRTTATAMSWKNKEMRTRSSSIRSPRPTRRRLASISSVAFASFHYGPVIAGRALLHDADLKDINSVSFYFHTHTYSRQTKIQAHFHRLGRPHRVVHVLCDPAGSLGSLSAGILEVGAKSGPTEIRTLLHG